MIIPPPPAELEHLARPLGAAALLALIEHHGGQRLYVPRHPVEDTPLAQVIGLPAAQALAAEWGGDILLVPLARSWLAETYRQNSISNAKIARRLRIHERSVERIFARKAESRQMELAL